MLQETSVEFLLSQFTRFSCSKNKDVENFLKDTAIRFEQADKARTYMIVPAENPKSKDGNLKILAYFSLSTKLIKIPKTLSKSKIKDLDGMNKNVAEIESYLIGQLAKNDTYSSLISGREILDYALNILYKCYELIGRRIVLVECENKQDLIDFYTENNFSQIGQDEQNGLLQFVYTISKYQFQQAQKNA